MLPIQETVSFFDQVRDAFQLETFTAWHFWTLLTVLFLVGEVLTAGFLLAAFVAGTVAALAGTALGLGFQGQLWCFSICRIAVEKAGDRVQGAVAGSDAFFPFPVVFSS